jgi:hypothetical protein
MDIEQTLWESIHLQENYIFKELATSLVGIGALFFAFGTVSSPLLRTYIALVGVGGSAILWAHAYAAFYDREGLFRELEKSEIGNKMLVAHRQAAQWRSRGWYGLIYVPITALATSFMGLVAIVWLFVLLENVGILNLTSTVILAGTCIIVIITYVNLQVVKRTKRSHLM